MFMVASTICCPSTSSLGSETQRERIDVDFECDHSAVHGRPAHVLTADERVTSNRFVGVVLDFMGVVVLMGLGASVLA